MDAFKLVSTSGEQTIDIKPGTQMVVGRAVNSDVPIYDPTISRQHAQLSVQNGGILVKDLGSSHGTFLDRSKITQAGAAPNVRAYFGQVCLQLRRAFKPADAPQPAPP